MPLLRPRVGMFIRHDRLILNLGQNALKVGKDDEGHVELPVMIPKAHDIVLLGGQLDASGDAVVAAGHVIRTPLGGGEGE